MHFAHISRYHGLTEEDAQKAMEILNGKLNTETEKELAKRRYEEEWLDVIDSESF